MSSDVGSPKREPTPTAASSLSSIPKKRALDDGHCPSILSPLNTETKLSEHQAPDDSTPVSRFKPTRVRKDTLKKREAKGGGGGGGEAALATSDPSNGRSATPESEMGPLRYKLAPPKPSDFDLPRGPVMASHHEVTLSGGQSVQFFETSEHVFNKKNFRYMHCIADPLFPSMIYYRQTEPEPFGPRMSFEDVAPSVYFDSSARQITTDKGFRMGRANVAVRQGRWYWECKITQGVPPVKDGAGGETGRGQHVRLGWARREASLDAPVGFDAYSYGIRDVAGEKVHMSRPTDFFPPGDGIREGDVIGLEIQLPSEHLQRKVLEGNYSPIVDAADDEHPPPAEASNIVRDRVPIRFRSHTYFEKIEYHPTKELEDLMNPSPILPGCPPPPAPSPNHPSPALRTLPNSCIRIYKNGVLVGTPFENLLCFLPPASKPMPQVGARENLDDGLLGYYPAVSVFRGGSAEVNFGPDFWFPPPGYGSAMDEVDLVLAGEHRRDRIHAVSERYHQQIAEDIVYDIIDEVDFWMKDAGSSTDQDDARPRDETPSALAPGREEIKELVQDD
ncbi:COMPASS complex protein [Drechmeria coniospora]|uniref:COMPASS complex protein n=1 Tax=Drechmeria coniospora TaxID=98403 RepID=A0A151GR92_DRECN|nr:COMPASS complex protein [Drechmeria coniospora]KYK59571.1 COMPASS complex protein [Drechmeria coniospora]ODA76739.1 hypothetical protein RJ55_08010 [Drechmeria coniospora]